MNGPPSARTWAYPEDERHRFLFQVHGNRCEEPERLLAAHRERRHEAEAAALALDREAAPRP
ncbi:hypothetical protein [Streptomyces sp. NPDC004546]|uniref:hypothetical protein n=1 Tax=Streptomyces sp. NPDC004546 TaxID=3154282 RepID=UPI0033A3E6C4